SALIILVQVLSKDPLLGYTPVSVVAVVTPTVGLTRSEPILVLYISGLAAPLSS
ncbi:hypothetical protein NDU88_005933, partial [Pleurodeles waltl]